MFVYIVVAIEGYAGLKSLSSGNSKYLKEVFCAFLPLFTSGIIVAYFAYTDSIFQKLVNT